ncbi:transcriptional regulator [Exiguobacterium sp. SH3S2]|uniref:winged helix-turn-helix transcriptional regulator n=1 Tax=unclassified Exiguobacterium TaxID=2644629 RepID=UPI00103FCF1E|nr:MULTISPECIES: helix-turn-helix domain-containing protein [unclassified Exiguobacterium]TCI24119.1 transcriptional regulator [Exiguobacterium sp. SH5S4]TCI42161.1 transcriptional regulator [Exiguobacterium sp. SH3S3]TCI52096.1 transcriptional regulator [Exiguobacterium sp. SH5S13]TCI58175.1 transcriptional regulator [Exiguobacterium sp. SH3S2]TCI60774.1 transcriptional regulator [Exiguobacterium sp. SH3S1]
MQECPVETIVQKISGKYKMLILHRLGTLGTKRFNELCRLFPQATPRTMTRQLRELEHDGLIIRTVYSEIPPRVEYKLSEEGRSLFPILEQLGRWEYERQGLPHVELHS